MSTSVAATTTTSGTSASGSTTPEPAKTEASSTAGTTPAAATAAAPAVAAKTEGAKTETEKTPEAAKAPEKYELKLPKESILDPSHIEKIEAFAKAQGLSNEKAQELLNRDSDIVAGYHESLKQKSSTQSQAWLQELKADPAIGGDKLEQSGKQAFNALKQIWGEEFATVVTAAGLNHHPVFFKGLVKLSKSIEGHEFVGGDGPSSKPKSTAELFYGNTQKQ
jgi:hypothetical protein